MGRPIGDCPILIIETMTIHEATQMAIQMNLSHIRRDSQIAVHSIIGKMKGPSQYIYIYTQKQAIKR